MQSKLEGTILKVENTFTEEHDLDEIYVQIENLSFDIDRFMNKRDKLAAIMAQAVSQGYLTPDERYAADLKQATEAQALANAQRQAETDQAK